MKTTQNMWHISIFFQFFLHNVSQFTDWTLSPLVVLRPCSRWRCLHLSCRRWADECVRRSTGPEPCHCREHTHTESCTQKLSKRWIKKHRAERLVSMNINGLYNFKIFHSATEQPCHINNKFFFSYLNSEIDGPFSPCYVKLISNKHVAGYMQESCG